MSSLPAFKAISRWRVYTSRVALGLLLLNFLSPAYCYCPESYLLAAGVALVPLLCGPKGYRILAIGAVGYALYAAERDYKGQMRERVFREKLRVQAEQQRLSQPHATP